MILPTDSAGIAPLSFPRIRGGDPAAVTISIVYPSFSPHPRGVILRGLIVTDFYVGFPRIRGGDPHQLQMN